MKWNDAISPDGKWRFDGKEWKAFHGRRTTMPVGPLGQPAPAVVVPQAPPAQAMPSWVAESEVARLDRERREREEAAAQAALPAIPLPPEQDWRRAGEHLEYSRPVRVHSGWQVGFESIVIFLALYLICGPLALIYIWRTGWRLRNKVGVTVFSFIVAVLFALVVIGSGQRPR
jgi:hypothetical protein